MKKIRKKLTGKILQNSLFHLETYFFDFRSKEIFKNGEDWYRNYLISFVERPKQARNVIFIDFFRIFCVLEIPALVSAY